MSAVCLARPWLIFDLGQKMQVLSWAINRPGFVTAQRIVWREVRNADLPKDMNVQDWFARELKAQGHCDTVAFLTSRDVSFFTEHTANVGQTTAHCVATVGLSNAERVGRRVDQNTQDWGTINVAVQLKSSLSRAGLIETISIATQARTAAVMDANVQLATGTATGTGTDCIAVAAPDGTGEYAGLHTDVGEAVGAAVYAATKLGADTWKSDIGSIHERMRKNAGS